MSANKPSPPIHYLLALYPGFQLLDVAGPLDILNLISLSQATSKNLTLTMIASTLDPVPVKPVSPLDPGTGKPKWEFHGLDSLGYSLNTTFNQYLVPDVTYDSYLSALHKNTISDSAESLHKPIDVLLIPGGMGTRITRKDLATGHMASNVADLIQFIPLITPHIRHSIMTVCTGSDILAQTGLLNSRRATTNMTRFDFVADRSPRVRWLRGRRYVRSSPADVVAEIPSSSSSFFNGEIWTSAGISAGMDVTLAFVAVYHGGPDVARDIARRLEYDWRGESVGEGQIDPMYGLPPEVAAMDQLVDDQFDDGVNNSRIATGGDQVGVILDQS